jgi:hypothetical protein
MNIPDKCKVDHLFLLIGENPLPNYVAARTLLKENGTIYLVHSTATASRADSLRRMLKPTQIQLVSLENKQANAQFIRNKVQKNIEEILQNQPDAQIGLNYTGGTKAMAVHAYRAIFEMPNLQHSPIFSYLDSESLQMLINCKDDLVHSEPVTLNVLLKDLFELHDLPWRKDLQPSFKAILPDATKDLLDIHLSKDLKKNWSSWCEKLRSKTHKNTDWREEKELADPARDSIDLNQLDEQIKKKLYERGIISSLETNALSIKFIHDEYEFPLLRDVCAWLAGGWLEHYVLDQVQNISKTCSIHESATAFHIQDQESDDADEKFELDVAFMRDYQLFAISCTTKTSKSDCKEKLFEAYIRARQLGGDEARVALVCFNETPDRIKRDLTPVLGENKFMVFGAEDLKPEKFAKKLANWVLENSPLN